MTKTTFTPRIGVTILVDRVGAVVAASNFDLSLHHMVRNVMFDPAWNPSGALVTHTKLAIDIEAPCIDITILSETGSMSVTRSAALNSLFLVCLVIKDANQLGSSNFSVLSNT